MSTKRAPRFAIRSILPLLVPALGLSAACSFEGPDLALQDLASKDAAASKKCAKQPKIGSLSASLLGRYETGLADLESSGETAALSGNRMFVTSAQAVVVDIVDVSDPAAPTLVKRVDLEPYGNSVQSVDVSSKGLVAVAVGGENKTDAGTVVLLDTDGTVVGTVSVGSLPDMVAFTPNGKQLVVANEGEPDCYGVGCTDPLGTVSIVNVHPLKKLSVTTLDFSGVALPPGVRVFGPGASAAQDLEPEGVTVSSDSKTAYVTLQENNALATVDLATATITEVRAFGYKDLSVPPTTKTYSLSGLPSIGTTAGGQDILLGGFSGLHFEGKTPDGKLRFLTHTDRGPNAEPTGVLRPFLLPEFSPRVVRLELDPGCGTLSIVEQISLKRADGSALTGLSNTAVPGGTASSAHNDEIPVDLFGNVLGLDPLGGDFEGIAVMPDGTFWMADEYRPALYHFDAGGTLLARLVPVGSHLAAGLPVPPAGAAGELGIEALPGAIGQRRQNRGFEALSLQGGKLYAMVQSPLRNPVSLSNAALNAMQNVRLVEVDPTTLVTRQFLYIMDNAASVGPDDTRADKIGDMTSIPGGGFLVLERDDDALPADPAATIAKKVYAFNLTGATDITTKDVLYAGKTLDQMTAPELLSAGIRPLAKVLHVDLVTAGYAAVQKVEGLAWIDSTTLAVVNDNDFRVAGIVVDQATGTFTLAPGYEPELEVLGIIEKSGIDASDRDNVMSIRNWPVMGMYQPDAITSFKAKGQTYLATANEGDARDYAGFAEEARAKSLAASFPGVPQVLNDAELGRLTITVAPPAGDFSVPYVFGTRSFSLWNASTGALVWDSGAELERRTGDTFPVNFNASNDSSSFDNRSDNKGPEPEGIAVGKVGQHTYAFVGLERIGGVVIYDVGDPTNPAFVTYLNPRDFTAAAPGPDSGPEIIKFVEAKVSPTGAPLLVVSNEISGTVTLWSLSGS